MSKHERNEKLTNWYMINLTWGVVGILALTAIYRASHYVNTLMMIQPMAWVLTGVFALGAIALFVLGKTQAIKNTSRANNYAIFTAVCALVSLWLALYNKLRMPLESLLRTITGNASLMVSSYWNVWIPMALIGVYLVGAFIYLVIKLAKR
jgi:hypothetical protein